MPTDFEILGYPGLALLFFLIAAGVGFVHIAKIVVTDRREKP